MSLSQMAAPGARRRMLFHAVPGKFGRYGTKVSKGLSCDIVKMGSDEERMVYGYASVIDNGDGKGPVVDSQDDMITEPELLKAAHRFIKSARASKVMHKNEPKAEVVESMVLRPEVAKALGIENFKKTAWVIGVKVHDNATWEQVKKGDLKAFSIGGSGRRKSVDLVTKSGPDLGPADHGRQGMGAGRPGLIKPAGGTPSSAMRALAMRAQADNGRRPGLSNYNGGRAAPPRLNPFGQGASPRPSAFGQGAAPRLSPFGQGAAPAQGPSLSAFGQAPAPRPSLTMLMGPAKPAYSLGNQFSLSSLGGRY